MGKTVVICEYMRLLWNPIARHMHTLPPLKPTNKRP